MPYLTALARTERNNFCIPNSVGLKPTSPDDEGDECCVEAEEEEETSISRSDGDDDDNLPDSSPSVTTQEVSPESVIRDIAGERGKKWQD